VDLTQRGDRGWKEAQRLDEDKVTLMKTLSYRLSFSNSQKLWSRKWKTFSDICQNLGVLYLKPEKKNYELS
jgi:hypothetical protein